MSYHGLGLIPGPLVAAPGTLAMGRPLPSMPTMDAVLSSCPTRGEIDSIFTDFNVTFDASVPPQAPWTCTPGGSESSIGLNIINLFRCAKALTFDTPMPLIGNTSIYNWLRSLGLVWHLTGDEISNAGGNFIHFRYQVFASPEKRYWLDPRSGSGMVNLLGLAVHEARHTEPGGNKGHACGPISGLYPGSLDTTLEYGGAWAVQYYYFRWLAEHSGSQLTAYQKTYASDNAAQLLSTKFCTPPMIAAPLRRTATYRPSEPPSDGGGGSPFLPPGSRPFGPPSYRPRLSVPLPLLWAQAFPPGRIQGDPRVVDRMRRSSPQIQAMIAKPRSTKHGLGNYVSACPACARRATYGLPALHGNCAT
jgi:hypothetical protein